MSLSFLPCLLALSQFQFKAGQGAEEHWGLSTSWERVEPSVSRPGHVRRPWPLQAELDIACLLATSCQVSLSVFVCIRITWKTEMKTGPHKNLYRSVHSSIVHKTQKGEAA